LKDNEEVEEILIKAINQNLLVGKINQEQLTFRVLKF
jgi:hypothetical protein